MENGTTRFNRTGDLLEKVERGSNGLALSAPFQLPGVCSHGVGCRRAKGNWRMKRPHALHTLLWIVCILLMLCGCTGPSQPQKQAPTARAASPVAPATQLRPQGVLPSSCPATPVYQGGPGKLSAIPWVQAQPTSSGIVGHLFYAQSATTKSGTYRFLHTGGSYPDGSASKILWIVDSPQASGPLQIDGTNLSNPGKTFHQTIEGSGEIPSIVVVPSAGCWRLQISSGKATGTLLLWVVG